MNLLNEYATNVIASGRLRIRTSYKRDRTLLYACLRNFLLQ